MSRVSVSQKKKRELKQELNFSECKREGGHGVCCVSSDRRKEANKHSLILRHKHKSIIHVLL